MSAVRKLGIGGLAMALLTLIGVAPAYAQAAAVGLSIQTLAPGVQTVTLLSSSPRNIIHFTQVAAAAPVRIKAVPAPARNGRSLATVSALCRMVGGLVCINGDFFGSTGVPAGGELVDGHWVRAPTASQQQVWVDGKNRFSLGAAPPGALQSLGATKYAIVLNGRPVAIPEHDSFASGRHARTLVGWNGAGTTFFVAVDQGRGSAGMSLAEAASLMVRLGATTAVNQDGGASSQFVVNGVVRNVPVYGQRSVANAWAVVATARH